MKNFPTLYHKGKNNELRQWRVWADSDKVYTEYGVAGGILQTSSKVCVPKNVGKKNETTAEQQAENEAQSLFTFKLERKYSLTPKDAQLPLMLPMLAQKYDAKKHKGRYFVQPKLDGVRCIARWEDNKVVLYSRQGKIYDVAHISSELEKIMGKDDVYDGEIYIHGVPLQNIISLVKKPQEASLQLEYWVYDIPVRNGKDDLGFRDRYDDFYNTDRPQNLIVKFTPTTYIGNDYPQISAMQALWIERGYEGAILREENSEYLWGYRSNELLKVKNFLDSEFLVVDVEEGVGKMAGHAIVVCQNDLTFARFRVVPKMSMDQRKEIFDNRANYIGRKFTVKYFDRTEDQIPRFPVGLAFRDDV